MEEVLIIEACRSPAGRLLGKLSSLTAPRLLAMVIEEAIRRSGIRPSLIGEVIAGNVLSAGIGQNPARQAPCWQGYPIQSRPSR